MIVYVLFVHKKSVSKRKVCNIFIKIKIKKIKKFSGFFWVVFWGVFWVGFLLATLTLGASRTRRPRRSGWASWRRRRGRGKGGQRQNRFLLPRWSLVRMFPQAWRLSVDFFNGV
jgi:hypothetical protein